MHSIPMDSHSFGFSKNHILFLTFKSACLFFPIPCFISQSVTSHTILNRYGERRHPCIISDDKRNIVSNLPLSMTYSIFFPVFSIILKRLRRFSFPQSFHNCLLWISQCALSACTERTLWFGVFIYIMREIQLIIKC